MEFIKFEHEHIYEVKKWAEHESIKNWIGIEDWEMYYKYANGNEKTFLFAIYKGKDFIGEFTAENDDDCLHICLIINPQFQNRGFGVEALNYFSKNVYSLTGIHPKYLHAGIFNKNIASIKCFEKAGYISHGVDKDGEERYLYIYK
ncbi:GNAT family N-acetyltransferase [Eubacteriales bacterium OttesenSCG-928-G02]|nr:GNAT family N-acetyltransferase [Eubacteriales bacterium OttesenSCG-928-G02]